MIYVFGHKGYIGSNLVKWLTDRGKEVQGVGRYDPMPTFTEYDSIVNAACHGWSPHQRGDVWQTVESNLLLPLEIQAARNGAQFIHLAASYEFHNPKVPYSRTKKIASSLLKGKAVILYIYTAFGGINEPPWRFMGSLIKACATGETYTITTPHATRDFTHVSRICEYIETMIHDGDDDDISHLGHGVPRYMAQVLGNLEGIAGKQFGNVRILSSEEGIENWRAEEPVLWDTFIKDLKMEWEKACEGK